MKAENDIFEIFDKFLSGSMPLEEKAAFLNRLDSDPDFSMEFKLYEITNEVIVDSGLDSVKYKLQQIHNPFWTPSKMMLGSIAFVGLLAVGSLLYVSDFEQNNFEAQDIVFEETSSSPKNTIETASITEISTERNKVVEHNSPKKSVKNNIREEKHATTQVETPANLKESQPEIVISGVNTKRNCDEVQISANILIENACKDAASGIITIDTANIDGGNGPYTYAILSSSKKVRKADIPFDTKTRYEGLKAGYYNFFIKDANGCTSYSERSALVNEVSCSAKLDRDFTLAAGNGVTLMILSNNQKADLIISDKNGHTIYVNQFSGNEVVWYGKDSFERKVKKGTYNYQLRFNDGSLHSGSIAIE